MSRKVLRKHFIRAGAPRPGLVKTVAAIATELGRGAREQLDLFATAKPVPVCGECGRRNYHLAACSQHPDKKKRKETR